MGQKLKKDTVRKLYSSRGFTDLPFVIKSDIMDEYDEIVDFQQWLFNELPYKKLPKVGQYMLLSSMHEH